MGVGKRRSFTFSFWLEAVLRLDIYVRAYYNKLRIIYQSKKEGRREL